MPDEHDFRHVMGHFATGVAVVTSREADGTFRGLTANSFASVSLSPPLVLVCLDRRSVTHASVVETGAFAVSVLSAGHERLARRFSGGKRSERFTDLGVRKERTGSPVIDEALAWLDCRVHQVHPAGDHSIVVGEVLACGAGAGDPLLFYGGGYARVRT